jgi:hypothetical protein
MKVGEFGAYSVCPGWESESARRRRQIVDFREKIGSIL